jgi:outer membrane protein TolC
LPIEPTWQAGPETDPSLADNGWLASFQDERLSQLVEEALRNNRDLQGSAAKVAEAEARARQAGADLLPTLDLASGATRSGMLDSSSTEDNFNLGLEVSWEVDLWARLRSEKQAQALDAIAAAADFEFARLSPPVARGACC